MRGGVPASDRVGEMLSGTNDQRAPDWELPREILALGRTRPSGTLSAKKGGGNTQVEIQAGNIEAGNTEVERGNEP